MSSIISRLSEKYSFNREINGVRIMKEKILLPAQPDGEPDYGFMENYAKNLEEKQLSRYMTYLRTV